MYGWPRPFLLAALPLPEALSLWNGRFFTAYPLTLGTLDPAFALPIGAVAAQAALLALGGGPAGSGRQSPQGNEIKEQRGGGRCSGSKKSSSIRAADPDGSMFRAIMDALRGRASGSY